MAKPRNKKPYDISQGGMAVVSSQSIDFQNGQTLYAKFTLFMPKTDEWLTQI